jgi:hypothetical protein
VALGISGSLSPGCRWLIEGIFLVVLLILVLLSPDTGYLVRVLLSDRGVTSPGCFGITNALVCFIRDLSLHNADISGKSIFLLFSLRVRISRAVPFSPLQTSVFVSLTLFTSFLFSRAGRGGGGGNLRLNVGGWGVSNEFKMLSSERVRMNRPGRFGGRGGGGGSRLPVDEILAAP